VRVFLDANILFSAAKSDGAMRRLLEALYSAGHDCWVDAYVMEEARRNLALKFPGGLPVLEALSARIHLAPHRTLDAALVATLPLPEKDRPVLAAAIQHGCAALVTGDRTHFGVLYGHTVHGVTVYSPRSLAESVLG